MMTGSCISANGFDYLSSLDIDHNIAPARDVRRRFPPCDCSRYPQAVPVSLIPVMRVVSQIRDRPEDYALSRQECRGA